MTDDTVSDIVSDTVSDTVSDIERSVKPYRGKFPSYDRLPEHGVPRDQVIRTMEELLALEQPRWADGYASGTVYHGDPEHVEFLDRVYALNSQANPLHADVWPSTVKFEAEVVSMAAHMLGGPEACGTVSSGGTESILLAMKAYRDQGRARGVERPAMVVPSTAHAAFDKASEYLCIEKVTVPVGPDGVADVAATEAAITPATVVVVGSAPCFPNGLIDPIAALSELARGRGTGCHVDACLGGFLLPWAERLGYAVPPFDFRLPGVTSISADTHKYGYASKGTSVVLYRDRDLRHHQYYTTAGWAGGLYFSPTFAGSRPGALSAACWAALVSIGEDGYLSAARRILETAATIKEGIRSIDGLDLIGDPLWNIAFCSGEVNPYGVLDEMGRRHWSLNGLQDPPALHICLTLRHTLPGVAERFLTDLVDAVDHVRANPGAGGTMAPIYGMATMAEMHGAVEEMLEAYVDLLFEV